MADLVADEPARDVPVFGDDREEVEQLRDERGEGGGRRVEGGAEETGEERAGERADNLDGLRVVGAEAVERRDDDRLGDEERDVRRRRPIALVVGDDLDAPVLVVADARVRRPRSIHNDNPSSV